MTYDQWYCIRKLSLFLSISLSVFFVYGQQLLHDGYLNRMKDDMEMLASDSLEGREAGSMGELWAALYIADRFENMGIAPCFNGCYYQDFNFPDGQQFLESDNTLTYKAKESGSVKSISLEWYTPLPWGGDGDQIGKVFDAGYGMEGLSPFIGKQPPFGQEEQPVFLIRFDAPPGDEMKTSLNALMQQKAAFAEEMGAKAIIFWDPEFKSTTFPGYYAYYSSENISVPVLFLKDVAAAYAMIGGEVEIHVKSSPKRSFGKNVAAKIDNGAKRTIVVGAHYDHLGYGYTNSRNEGLPAIHYGADDNASGVTGMLALAEYLHANPLSHTNIIFVAFSAEEKGLIGSRFFTEQEEINPQEVLCMLNFDMIGRVDRVKPEIRLLASGSSPRWDELLQPVQEDVKGISVPGSTSGSDHHYFYQKRIPVLFFFSGLHEDYHKPSDIAAKINYHGIRDVVEYTVQLLHILDTVTTLPFIEVDSGEGQRSRRSGKISLGIIPAHGVDVQGVQVEDVIPMKPAALGGIQPGDIIINIEGNHITNIIKYMQALDSFSAGQIIKVKVLRNGSEVALEVHLNE